MTVSEDPGGPEVVLRLIAAVEMVEKGADAVLGVDAESVTVIVCEPLATAGMVKETGANEPVLAVPVRYCGVPLSKDI